MDKEVPRSLAIAGTAGRLVSIARGASEARHPRSRIMYFGMLISAFDEAII
jgi:hypothetical protein